MFLTIILSYILLLHQYLNRIFQFSSLSSSQEPSKCLFSDNRGTDWRGEGCPLLACCCENSFLFTHTYFREITSVYGMWGLVTNFKYTDAGQFILTSLRSYVLGESTKRNSLSWTSLIHCTLLPSPRLDKFPWIKFHRIYSKVSHTFRQFRVFLQVNCQPSPLFWISWHVPETRLFVKNKKWTTVI